MPKVKSAAEIAAKYVRVAATRQGDYESGVRDTTVNWQTATAAARESYEQGVQESISRGAYLKGVEAAGNDKWRDKTLKTGAGRWGPGVRDAESDMAAGIAPFIEVIERTVLPPRGPRGDPRNLERAAVMARALSDARKRA
jgi:hypothetical protein